MQEDDREKFNSLFRLGRRDVWSTTGHSATFVFFRFVGARSFADVTNIYQMIFVIGSQQSNLEASPNKL